MPTVWLIVPSPPVEERAAVEARRAEVTSLGGNADGEAATAESCSMDQPDGLALLQSPPG